MCGCGERSSVQARGPKACGAFLPCCSAQIPPQQCQGPSLCSFAGPWAGGDSTKPRAVAGGGDLGWSWCIPRGTSTALISAALPAPQICSLMRGGIAEKGGIRVGHRIIEINGQSVVATPHEKIIQILTQAVSEVRQTPAGGPPRSLCSLQTLWAGLGALPQQPPAWGWHLPADPRVSA